MSSWRAGWRKARRGAAPPRLRGPSSAVGQTLTFLIALALFVPAFVLLITFTQDQGDTTNARVADLDTKSRLALDVIVGQSGAVAGSSSSNWEDLPQPHALERIGLRDEQRNALDYDKVRRLAGGTLDADSADGKLNYQEFKDALGLGARYDFHLRSYPIFEANAANRYGTDDLPPVRVAYVGDYVPGTWNVLTGTALPATVNGAQPAPLEIAALDGLNVAFRPALYRPDVASLGLLAVDGDAYADVADDLDGLPGTQPYLDHALFLSGRLALYDVLVFGSEIEQTMLNPHKDLITDFVEGGGVVLALGSEQMSPSWANGILKVQAGQVQGNKLSGPLTTPDDSHALLTTPNRLDHQAYLYATKKWALDRDEEYALILAYPEDAAGNKVPTELSVSNDGYYANDGAVFISNVDVYRLPGEERFKLLANELLYAFLRSVFIDFGPEMDPNALARSATRVIPIETRTGAVVDAKVLLYVWRAG